MANKALDPHTAEILRLAFKQLGVEVNTAAGDSDNSETTEDSESTEASETSEDTENSEGSENKEDKDGTEESEGSEDTEGSEDSERSEETEHSEDSENSEDTENSESLDSRIERLIKRPNADELLGPNFDISAVEAFLRSRFKKP